MGKPTDNNRHEEKSPAAGAERFFNWRLTERDKRFLRDMNISPD